MMEQGVDGAKIAFGNKLKVELGAADFSNPLSSYTKLALASNTIASAANGVGGLYFKDAVWAKLGYNTSKATALQGWYLKNTSGLAVADIYSAGVTSTVAENLVFRADYIKNNADASKGMDTNQQYQLLYRGLNPEKAHTWGLGVDYGKAQMGASFNWGDYNTIGLYPTANVQSLNAFYEQTLLKNVTMKVGQSFNSKNPQTGAPAAFGEWSRVEFNFFF